MHRGCNVHILWNKKNFNMHDGIKRICTRCSGRGGLIWLAVALPFVCFSLCSCLCRLQPTTPTTDGFLDALDGDDSISPVYACSRFAGVLGEGVFLLSILLLSCVQHVFCFDLDNSPLSQWSSSSGGVLLVLLTCPPWRRSTAPTLSSGG